MIRVGIVSNPVSDGNGGRSTIAEFAAYAAGKGEPVAFAVPPSVDTLSEVLTNFARRGVSVVGVDGGDGTLRDVLGALPAAYGEAWPAIAILPSGKTNLIARDVGSFGGGVAGVRRLLHAARTPDRMTVRERPCLEAVWDDNVVRGMFGGAGVLTSATRLATAGIFRHGVKQNLGVAVTMAQVLRQAYAARSEFSGVDLAIADDETVMPPSSPHFLFLATTLNQLMLGFWPFPGERRSGIGALHWLALGAPPRRLLRTLWRAWRGSLIADPANGLRCGNAASVTVRFGAPFVVDGEIFDPGDACVTWRTGRSVRFLAM
jgi:hypothetical protein